MHDDVSTIYSLEYNKCIAKKNMCINRTNKKKCIWGNVE